MKLNIANTLTWIRIAAIPVMVLTFYSGVDGARPWAGLVFAAASITDILDGYIARRLNQTSKFGEFLDPVADKLIVAIALILLVQSDPRITVTLVAAIIIGREITVSALREWMAGLGDRQSVGVSVAGKLKTILQMTGLSFMLYARPLLGLPTYDIGFVLMLLAAGMTLWSMVMYVRAAIPAMSENS